jgi:hypothetical protein
VDPETRTALLGVGVAFCAFFALLTVATIIEDGFDWLTALSLAIVALLGIGLLGAIMNPPED